MNTKIMKNIIKICQFYLSCNIEYVFFTMFACLFFAPMYLMYNDSFSMLFFVEVICISIIVTKDRMILREYFKTSDINKEEIFMIVVFTLYNIILCIIWSIFIKNPRFTILEMSIKLLIVSFIFASFSVVMFYIKNCKSMIKSGEYGNLALKENKFYLPTLMILLFYTSMVAKANIAKNFSIITLLIVMTFVIVIFISLCYLYNKAMCGKEF